MRTTQAHSLTSRAGPRRAEELLGRPIEHRRLELEAALALAHAFGDQAVAD